MKIFQRFITSIERKFSTTVNVCEANKNEENIYKIFPQNEISITAN